MITLMENIYSAVLHFYYVCYQIMIGTLSRLHPSKNVRKIEFIEKIDRNTLYSYR